VSDYLIIASVMLLTIGICVHCALYPQKWRENNWLVKVYPKTFDSPLIAYRAPAIIIGAGLLIILAIETARLLA